MRGHVGEIQSAVPCQVSAVWLSDEDPVPSTLWSSGSGSSLLWSPDKSTQEKPFVIFKPQRSHLQRPAQRTVL